MVGIALPTTALTVYVQFIAVGGGMLLSALTIDASLGEMAGSFFPLASPLDLVVFGHQEPAVRRRDRR